MLILAVACFATVLVIWLGYPLIVGLLAALVGRRARPSWVEPPSVSVVLATLDPPDVVERRIADVLAADYPADRLEVVVALDQRGGVALHEATSPDGTGPERTRVDPRVRYVAGDVPGGKASTLNAAVRSATGTVLVFTDSAQRFDRQAIRRLIEALADPSMGAVSGALQIGRDDVPATLAERYWVLERWLREREAKVHSTVGVTGAIYAMRRECWLPLPAGVILDDVYGPMRLVLSGYRVGFEPTALAVDERRFPPGQEFKRKARTLTGVLQLCAWLPAVLVPWRNPLWLQFLFHKLLRLATPYLMLVGLGAGAAWLAGGGGVVSPWTGSLILLAGGALVLLAIAAVPRVRRAAAMALAMQGAVLRATLNGIRGQWDVWSR